MLSGKFGTIYLISIQIESFNRLRKSFYAKIDTYNTQQDRERQAK